MCPARWDFVMKHMKSRRMGTELIDPAMSRYKLGSAAKATSALEMLLRDRS